MTIPVLRPICLLFLAVLLPCTVLASGGRSERIDVEEKLGQQVPLDARFRDEDGKAITMKELLGKPVVLSFVYLDCSHNCPILLGGLAGVLDRVDFDPSKDYSLVTVSFDENDTPERAREKKRNYLGAVGRPFPEKSWRFLTGDRENIKKLADAVGFNFRREKNGFAHPVALTVLSPGGKVVRYLYGRTFLPFDLTMAIAEASSGREGLSVERMRLFCFSYDPPGRRYVYNILKVYGTVTILFVLSFFLYLTITGKKSKVK